MIVISWNVIIPTCSQFMSFFLSAFLILRYLYSMCTGLHLNTYWSTIFMCIICTNTTIIEFYELCFSLCFAIGIKAQCITNVLIVKFALFVASEAKQIF